MKNGLVKKALKRFIFPDGSIRTVVWGPCRGLRYRVFPGYGLAYIYGGWERDVVAVMCKHIRRGDVIYDLGANYGMHTLLFSRLVGSEGLVYAFEPQPAVFQCLREQLQLNRITNVETVPEAVSDTNGIANLDPAHHRGAAHLSDGGGEGIPIETVTLDVFTGSHRPPNFIKIDIEGAESRALLGAMNTIRKHRPTMIIELHNPVEDRAVGRVLLDCGYRVFRVKDGSEVLNLQSGHPDPEGMSGIVLCVPR